MRHSWVLAAAALLLAAPSWASSLVEVRVGNHPTYTRVVFEFDRPTGYRFERKEAEGTEVLVVTLEADSKSRNITSRSAGVESVVVDAAGAGRSVARILMRHPDRPVREMILSNPPRVVLDLIDEKAAALASAKKAAEARAAATPAPPQPATAKAPATPKAPAVTKTPATAKAKAPLTPKAPATAKTPATPKAPALAKTPAEPKAAAPPPPAPVRPAPAAESPKPRTAPAVSPAPAREPEPEVVAKAPAPPPARKPPEPVLTRPQLRPPPAPAPRGAGPEEPAEAPKTGGGKSAPADRASAPGAPAVAKPAPPASKPAPRPAEPRRVAEVKPEAKPAGAPFDLVTAGSIAAGVVVFVLLVVYALRRRSLPNDLDVTALSLEREGGPDDADEDRVPAGGFSTQPPETAEAGAGEEAARHKRAAARPVVPRPPEKEEEDEELSLFDNAPRGEPAMMNQEVSDLPASRTDASSETHPTIAPPMTGGSADLSRVVQELERRLAQVETRLDESIEARERLERQVAAQSEELRVQRAAIARTQRALRSLSRSEEEGATEPAPRDPNKPSRA